MKRTIFPILAMGLMTWACQNPGGTGSESDTKDSTKMKDREKSMEDKMGANEKENNAPETYEKGDLKIYPLPKTYEYPKAALNMKMPEDDAVMEENTVNFNFTVENYDLGVQTPDAKDKGLANSSKGQHIHLIIDNKPYSAHYKPKFEKEVKPGHHYAIAFLSRSYHESVKNNNAFKVFQFTAGGKKDGAKMMDMKKPMLFYSRPKGTYSGKGAKKVLFDFYLHNADIKPSGHSVMLTVNDSLSFEFDKWQPYIIEGLPLGKNKLKIALVDAQGNAINAPVNTTTRTVTLKK